MTNLASLSPQTSTRPTETPEPLSLMNLRVSVVIPTLNEATNLPYILPAIPSWVHEVLVIDGHSTDDTIATARELLPSARVILQDGRGKGNALACGFAAAEGELIVMLDADGSTDPSEIQSFIEPLLDGADFAKGSRCLAGGGSEDISTLRSFGNAALTRLVNILYRRRYSDLCYGFNAFWSYCLPYMRVDCDGFEVETLIHVRIARTTFEVREVPSIERARIHGVSNLNAIRDGWRVLKTILSERFGSAAQTSTVWKPTFKELGSAVADPVGVSNWDRRRRVADRRGRVAAHARA